MVSGWFSTGGTRGKTRKRNPGSSRRSGAGRVLYEQRKEDVFVADDLMKKAAFFPGIRAFFTNLRRGRLSLLKIKV